MKFDFKKYYYELRYFWKFFLPGSALLVTAILISTLYGTKLIRIIYHENLLNDIDAKGYFLQKTLVSKIAEMEMMSKNIRNNDVFSSSALYAFDNIIKDSSLLYEQMKNVVKNTYVDTVIVESGKNDLYFYTALKNIDHDILSGDIVNSIEMIYDDNLINLAGHYFLHVGTSVKIFGEDHIANLHLLRAIDSNFIYDLSNLVGVPLVLPDNLVV